MESESNKPLTWQFEECYLVLTSNPDSYSIKMVFKVPNTLVLLHDDIRYMHEAFFEISFNPEEPNYYNGINKLSDLHRKLNGKSAQWIFKFLRNDELPET